MRAPGHVHEADVSDGDAWSRLSAPNRRDVESSGDRFR